MRVAAALLWLHLLYVAGVIVMTIARPGVLYDALVGDVGKAPPSRMSQVPFAAQLLLRCLGVAAFGFVGAVNVVALAGHASLTGVCVSALILHAALVWAVVVSYGDSIVLQVRYSLPTQICLAWALAFAAILLWNVSGAPPSAVERPKEN